MDQHLPETRPEIELTPSARAKGASFCAGGAALCCLAAALGGYPPMLMLVAGVLALLAGVLAAQSYYTNINGTRLVLAELEDAHARAGGILESAMDAVIATDSEQRIVIFNSAAERVFGWSRHSILGKSLSTLLPQRFRALHAGHVSNFGVLGTTRRKMGGQTILTGLRADGTEFPIEASISQYALGGGKLFMAILRDVTERVQAEEALRKSKQELSALANAVNIAREEEKTRIARELHDELAQGLTALKMDISWARKRLLADLPDVSARLAAVERTVDTTVAATRRIAADLRPLMLDDLGLVAAAEWLAEKFTERTGVPVHLALEGAEDSLPEAHATAIFRILQESLTNVARHAQARNVDISVERDDNEILVHINDDGAGFEPQAERKPTSFGLLGLRERAYILGGDATIDSAPGRGTRILIRLPLLDQKETA